MISKSIIHRLFVTRARSIYHFTPKVIFGFLRSSNEQLVCGPTTKPNPSQANERVGPLVQDLELVLKGTTFLLSLQAGRSEFHLTPYVPSYSPSLAPEIGGLLSRRTRATLIHANLRIISNKQEFIVSSGLRSSYLGHRMKKSISTLNDIIKWEWFSSWFDLMPYSLLNKHQ